MIQSNDCFILYYNVGIVYYPNPRSNPHCRSRLHPHPLTLKPKILHNRVEKNPLLIPFLETQMVKILIKILLLLLPVPQANQLLVLQ